MGNFQNKMACAAWFLALFTLLCISKARSITVQKVHPEMQLPSGDALKALQTKIRYQFQDQGLLMRAITHSSYSLDNNGALNVLGADIIQVAISLHYVLENSAIAKGDLFSMLTELSNSTACLVDALKLDLPNLIRVAPKVDPSSKNVACDCYHALFGAISVDAKSSDIAKAKYWLRHGWNSRKKFSGSILSNKNFIES